MHGQLGHHGLVRLVRHDQVDALQERRRDPVRVRERLELVDHLHQVAAGQRLDLRPVDGDVVVEVGVRPDDRVDLAHRTAGVGLHELDVGRLAVGGDTDHDGGGAVAEDHAGRPDVADLVGELLHADDAAPGAAPPAASASRRTGRRAARRRRRRCRRRRASGRCPSWPESQVATDGISRVLVQVHTSTAPISSGPRPGMVQRSLGGLQRDLLEAVRGVAPLLDTGLVADLVRRPSATSCRRRCGSGPRCCRRRRRAPRPAPRSAASR